MAEMIPETLGATQEASTGEKRVFNLLRDALKPDKDCLVWFEPKATTKRTDFLVWSQTLGLLVIEVKDWGPAYIKDMNPDRWQVEGASGGTESRESPTEQVRRCFFGFKELFKLDGRLCHADGRYAGLPKFRIGYCVIFANITRKQAVQMNMMPVLGKTTCLFADDLAFDVDAPDAQRHFIDKLDCAFHVRFPFSPFTPDELNVLRFLIFPEVRVRSIRELRSTEDSELIKTLDLEQERAAKSIPEGHWVLKGVAGSGKSLVICWRAKYLKKLHPEWRILILYFTVTGGPNLQHLLNIIGPDCDVAGIEVHHYHGLVKKLTNANLRKLSNESKEQWDARMAMILREWIARGAITERYDAILIDEGQDLVVEWTQSVIELLNEKTDSLLFCLDPAQNIFGRKITYKSVGIKVQGKRPILLKKSYRNTVEILELASRFSKVTLEQKSQQKTEENLDSLLFPMHTERHGMPPQVIENLSPEAQIRFVMQQIDQYTRADVCSWGDIAILYVSPSYPDFPARFSREFTARFGANHLYWITESRESKSALDFTSETVKLSTIESAKGMEFRVAFLIGLEVLPRSDRDESSERSLAYVGLTRAQDALYILGAANTGFFKEIASIYEESAKATTA